MDMCYDGTLVMPLSYAVMDEDEMNYVEGGISFTVKKDTCATISTYISSVLRVCATALGIAALEKKLTAGIVAIGKGIKAICGSIGGLIGIIIGTIAAALVTTNGVSFCVGCVTADRKNKAVKMSWYGAGFGNFVYK